MLKGGGDNMSPAAIALHTASMQSYDEVVTLNRNPNIPDFEGSRVRYLVTDEGTGGGEPADGFYARCIV